MKKKKIIISAIVVILLLTVLWFSGIIPTQIAKIYATNYMQNNYPEMQLEYVNIEWSKYHEDYLITFKDKNNQNYSCVIGPKYFPVSIEQGLLTIEETYNENYLE